MPILQITDATFMWGGGNILASLQVRLEIGERVTCVREEPFSASLLARIAGGIIKPSAGNVFIGDYDPAIQPVQAKRLLGFVPATNLAAREPRAFEAYIKYRAALWSVELQLALERAYCARSLLGSANADFTFALAGALISAPPLVVIDQPPNGSAASVISAIGNAALLTTHTSAHEASAWGI